MYIFSGRDIGNVGAIAGGAVAVVILISIVIVAVVLVKRYVNNICVHYKIQLYQIQFHKKNLKYVSGNSLLIKLSFFQKTKTKTNYRCL